MAIFLDTRGNQSLAIGICGRCSTKFPINELSPDPNTPGLMVCKDDRDVFDPWRLPPREPDDIVVDNPRPDVPLDPDGETDPIGPSNS